MTTEPVVPSPVDGPPPPPAAPPAPESATEPGTEPAADQVPARRPRRPRPVLLLVSGLVLGTAAGGGIGYAVQAGRPPTPLPPVQVALPTYPAGVQDPAAAASTPSPLAIDGDLRKLLITAPSGSKAWDDYPDTPSWITVGERADTSGKAASVFGELNRSGFRRAVEVDWQQGDMSVRVSLVQFGPDSAAEVEKAAKRGITRLQPFADNANGGYEVSDKPAYWAETTEQYYPGIAVAQRGTVLMEIKVFGTKPVDAEFVKGLAKQQWERLV
ncbi:hypothetical protein [Kitasatospora sp. NPDC057541]|uniref:hypothetical protein n=1 Tax=Kitasatospora sp. NPDC057541 TaxID=3346161 RepID=UPI00368CB859